MDKKLSLVPVWYWLISQRDESARFATKWPESSRVSTFAKVHDQMPLFFARAKGPTISANRDMRNSNRKLINVHDAKRIVNLSKNSQQLLLKWKFGCFFTKWFFLVFAMFKWQPMHAEKSWFVNPPFVRSPCGKMALFEF